MYFDTEVETLEVESIKGCKDHSFIEISNNEYEVYINCDDLYLVVGNGKKFFYVKASTKKY